MDTVSNNCYSFSTDCGSGAVCDLCLCVTFHLSWTDNMQTLSQRCSLGSATTSCRVGHVLPSHQQARVLRTPLQSLRAITKPPAAARIVSTSAGNDSVDPLSSRTVYEPGFTLTVHSNEQLQTFIQGQKEKLVVLMCKSSHCR